MTFSEKLQQLRKDQRLSQEELADRLEVSRQAISKWEVGEVPNLENLIKISKFFGCTLDYLVNDDAESGEQKAAAGEVPERAGAEAPAGTQGPAPKKRRVHLPSLLLGVAIPLIVLAAAALIRSANPPKRAMLNSFNGWWMVFMDDLYGETRVGGLLVENDSMSVYLDRDAASPNATYEYTYTGGLLDMDLASKPFSPIIESSDKVIFDPPNDSWRWTLVRPQLKNCDVFLTTTGWDYHELDVDPKQKEFDVIVSCEMGIMEAVITDKYGETICGKQTLTAGSDSSFSMHVGRQEGYTGPYFVAVSNSPGPFSADPLSAGWYAWE